VSRLPNGQDFIYVFILYIECNMRTVNLFGRVAIPDNYFWSW